MTRLTKAPASLALRHTLRLLGVAAALALCVPAAQAQKVYRCKTSSGQVNLSDKPCADQASEQQVVYAAEPGRVRVKDEPAHWAYLNAECRTLLEAVHRPPAGRYYVQSQRDVRKEYQQRCQENETEAYARAREQRQADRQQREAIRGAETAQVQRSAAKKQQCEEMQRVLVAKRKRDDLTLGQKDDLQLFQQNYRERCS